MDHIDITTTPTEAVISAACTVLANGGLLIFPTETTYGAGVDATNPAAVAKLLAYKSRREGKPLSIAVTDKTMAQKYVELNAQAEQLIDQFLPGPITVVCTSKQTVAPGVASEFNTVGIRIPDYPLMLEIIAAFGKPITATSANASDKKRPYSLNDIFSTISNKQRSYIDLALDAGTLPTNPPSTVIDTTLATPITLRQGELLTTHPIQTALTTTELETKQLAGKLLLKHWNSIRDTGLFVALDGPLGAGKTVFTKGIAEFLHIPETITSPTYSYLEEYSYTRHTTTGMLYHLDVWKINSLAEAERLEIEQLLRPGSVIVIEWFSNIKEHILSLSKKHALPILMLTIEQKNEKTRNITIQTTNE